MNNEFKVILQAHISANSKIELDKQIQQISKSLNEVPIKLKIDTKTLDNIKFRVQEFQKMQGFKLENLVNVKDINRLNELKTRLKELDYTSENVSKEMISLRNDITLLGRESSSTSKSIAKFAASYVSIYEVINLGKRAVTSMVDEIYKIDESLVELSKTTNLSTRELNLFANEVYVIGKELSTTMTDVIEATSSFSRAGFNILDSAELAQQAIIMKNISENMKDTGDNATALTNILKGYNLQVKEATRINDIFNNISNNQNITFDQLVTGVREISAVMDLYGNTIEETSAMLTGIISVTGISGEEASKALRTITMRLAGLNDEGEKDVELMAKLNDEFGKIANMNLMTPAGEMKDMYDIVDEYVDKIKELNISQEKQYYLAEKIAGKQRMSSFVAMTSNWDTVRESIDLANSSLGSSMEEQRKYENSLRGVTDSLIASFQKLSMNTIDSDIVKFLLKTTDCFVQLTDKVGVLNIALMATATYLSISKNTIAINGIGNLSSMFKTLAASVNMANLALVGTIGLIGVGVFAGVKIFDAVTESISELEQKSSEAKTRIEQINTKLEQLRNMPEGEQQQKTIESLERELQLRQDIADTADRKLAEKEVFGDFVTEMFTVGVKGKGSLSQSKELNNSIMDQTVKLLSLKNAIEDVNISDKEKLKLTDEKLKLEEKLTSTVGKALEYNDNLAANIDKLNSSQRDQVLAQQETSTGLINAAQNALGYSESIGDVENAVIDTTNSIDDAVDSIESLSTALEELESVADDTIDNVYLLDETIRKLSESKVLTGKEIDNLCKKFPELIDKVTETNGVYGIEIDVLEDLRTQSINTANDMAESQKIQTQNAINQAKSRIQSYKSEILALSQLGQAILTTGRTLQSVADIDSRDMESMTGLEKSSLFGSLENDSRIKAEKENIKQLEESLKAIENLENRIEYATSNSKYADGLNSSTKSSSGGSNSSASNIAKDIKDKLQAELDKIQKPRLELDYEIDILNAKLDTATLKNDQKSIEIINKQLADLLNKRKELTATQNVELGSLKTKFTDETSLKEINGLMEDNSKEWWKDLNNIIQKNIDVINSQKDAFDKQLSKYDLDIEQQQSKLSILQLQNGEVNEQVDLYKSLSSSYLEQQYYIEESLKNMYSQRSTLNESSKEYELITQNILDYENKLVDAMKSQADVKSDLIDLAHEQMEIELEKAIYGSSGKDEWKKDNDDKIQALQDELYLIESQAAAKKKKEEAEKRELELQQLKDKLANLRNQKTQQEYRKQADGSFQWEYVADKQAIADVEKEIADKQVEIEKAAEEQKLEDKKQYIKDQISQLQNLEKAKEESYTRSLEDLNLAMENEKFAWTLNGEEVSGIVENALTNVSGIYDVKMSDILSNVQSKLDSIRDAFDSAMNMANNMPSGGSSSGGGGGSSNTVTGATGKEYEIGSDGTITVSRPDGTTSTVKPSDSNYDKTNSAMMDDLKNKKFASGGETSSTGWHWLDGNVGSPERVLSAEQTEAFEIGMKNIPLFNETMKALFDLATPQVSRLKAPTSNPTAPSISFGDINLPNVKDARGFANEVREVVSDMFSGISNQAKLKPVN